jgi:hypothetical protein
LATRPRRAADAPSDWTLLVAFMIEELLAPDDLVRMIEHGIAPRMEAVRETVGSSALASRLARTDQASRLQDAT